VYRASSVIMCSSALILQSFAVTAVRFEMGNQFSTRALRAQNQYMCTEGSESVHVHKHVPNKRALEKVFCGNIVQIF